MCWVISISFACEGPRLSLLHKSQSCLCGMMTIWLCYAVSSPACGPSHSIQIFSNKSVIIQITLCITLALPLITDLSWDVVVNGNLSPFLFCQRDRRLLCVVSTWLETEKTGVNHEFNEWNPETLKCQIISYYWGTMHDTMTWSWVFILQIDTEMLSWAMDMLCRNV